VRECESVSAEIRQIAREELGVIGVADDEELASRFDSLALLSLVVAIENRFRVTLTEEDAARVRSLADLARIVAERLGAGVAP